MPSTFTWLTHATRRVGTRLGEHDVVAVVKVNVLLRHALHHGRVAAADVLHNAGLRIR